MFWPVLTPSLSGMMWRMCRRSRTICLSLAFITVFLHLLLALFFLSTYHQTCDTPLPPRTHILRELAHTSGRAALPADTTQGDSSTKDAKKDAKGHERRVSASLDMAVSVGSPGAVRAQSLESGLSKLEALFDHSLYTMSNTLIPEEDWLLKVKPKIKASEKSSHMWSVWSSLCAYMCNKIPPIESAFPEPLSFSSTGFI